MVELNVSETTANRVIDQMEEELQSMENTLNSFRSNNLTHTEAYNRLQTERAALERDRDNLLDQLEDEEDDDTEGLGNLFG
jgi:chromosome segregation ATPase